MTVYKRLQRILFTVTILLMTIGAVAQQPYYRKYTQEDGFSGRTTYNIVQDSRGFLWFSTDNGVCRFDGRIVKQYNLKNSLFDLGVFHLYKDNKDRIWGISIFSAPAYYTNNSFHKVPQALYPKVRNTRWILEDSNGYIYFLTYEGNVIRWKEGNSYSILSLNIGSLESGAIINDSTIIVSGNGFIKRISNFKNIELLPLKGYTQQPNRFYKLADSIVIGYTNDGLYEYTADGYSLLYKHADALSSVSYNIHIENDTTLWLCTRNGIHVFVYKNKHLVLKNTIMEGKEILCVLKDKDANYWISSGNEGVFFRSAIPNRYFPLHDNVANIKNIYSIDSFIHVFSGNGSYYRLGQKLQYEGNCVEYDPTLMYLKTEKISDSCMLVRFRGKNVLLTSAGMKHMLPSVALSSYNHIYYRGDKKLFVVTYTEDNKLAISTWSEKQVYPVIDYGIFFNLGRTFCFDYLNRTWTTYGDTVVCAGITHDGTAKIYRLSTNGIYISDIKCDAYNNIWLATRGNGLYCYQQNHTLVNYNTDNGLVSNSVSSTYIDDDNNIWVCTENGLNKIQNKATGKRLLIAFTKENLLPVTSVYSAVKKQGWVYAGTADGVFAFKDIAPEERKVNTYIMEVSINGIDVPLTDKYTISYGESISIAFSTVDYNQSAPPTFHYLLDGSEDQWHTTNNAQIQYGQLKPGMYSFHVYVDGHPKGESIVVIKVLAPYWQKPYFFVFIVLLFIGIIIVIVRWMFRIRQRKNERERRMLENDLKSLRAQINPHFIFNSLNSIQDFILDQQPRIANHYLTQFARLMRTIVDNSTKEWVSISDEIAFLRLYLELEKLRLGDSFDFSIITDSGVNITQLFIPPMLIQPIAENSIKHGLAAKAGNKKLEIHFTLHKEQVYCLIKDNGVGRKYAMAIEATRSHSTSTGIANIRERLQLLHKDTSDKKTYILYKDLYDAAHPAGTLVELYIPYKIDLK